jgi:hypothetical protein
VELLTEEVRPRHRNDIVMLPRTGDLVHHLIAVDHLTHDQVRMITNLILTTVTVVEVAILQVIIRLHRAFLSSFLGQARPLHQERPPKRNLKNRTYSASNAKDLDTKGMYARRT